MIFCCAVTYSYIACFSPYIYSHKLSDADEIAQRLTMELSNVQTDKAETIISAFNGILSTEYDDEFVFHMFKLSGEEIALPALDAYTGSHINDYKKIETSGEYSISLENDTEEYILLITKNINKESQVINALQKSLPIMTIIILTVSVISAFFYTWYMTKPIKKISKLSEQMAAMDFSGLCFMNRTDEIGILSHNLTDLSKKLMSALSELQEANQKLQSDINLEKQLEQQRVKFFSAASHELKTPITIIKGQLQGMLYQVGRYKDREAYLAQSLEVVGTLEKMVQELLTISRLDAPDYVCNKCQIDLSKLVNERIAVYEDLFMQKELFVEKNIASEAYVLGDPILLQKVLDNLLGNAAAYSGAGNHVIIRLREEDEKVKLTIENTGAHIPKEDIPKLFEAFYRVEQSRNRQTGGSGLGLYIVKTILDLHEAEINIDDLDQSVLVTIQF